jgi:hypothetical protein
VAEVIPEVREHREPSRKPTAELEQVLGEPEQDDDEHEQDHPEDDQGAFEVREEPVKVERIQASEH